MDRQEIREAMAIDERRLGGPQWRPKEDFEWRMLVGGRSAWRRWADKLYNSASSSPSNSRPPTSSFGSTPNFVHNLWA